MILNIKKFIEYKVDIKNLRKNLIQLLILLISILFPLNQQLHFKPYPSVDGFIIDYLIVKISIPEILLIFLSILRIPDIFKWLKKQSSIRLFFIVLSIFFLVSAVTSEYRVLAIYEQFILLLLIANAFTLKTLLTEFNLNVFIKSIKVWFILLSLLGITQFYLQSSVLNSYAIFGEFPYSEDYYHIKQKGFIFQYLIPPYSIFSHSNIFGGFLLISVVILGAFKKDSFLFHLLLFAMLLIIGSFNVFICYILWILLCKFKILELTSRLFFGIFFSLYLIIFLFSFNHQAFIDNSSVYRRLYMFDLTRNFFENNSQKLLTGVGYFNYFEFTKDMLYDYELVRFFQPQHNIINFLVWQYGVFLPVFLILILWRSYNKLTSFQKKFIFIILVGSTFDHFFITNHQVKFLIFLAIPYSLMFENSIK